MLFTFQLVSLPNRDVSQSYRRVNQPSGNTLKTHVARAASCRVCGLDRTLSTLPWLRFLYLNPKADACSPLLPSFSHFEHTSPPKYAQSFYTVGSDVMAFVFFYTFRLSQHSVASHLRQSRS